MAQWPSALHTHFYSAPINPVSVPSIQYLTHFHHPFVCHLGSEELMPLHFTGCLTSAFIYFCRSLWMGELKHKVMAPQCTTKPNNSLWYHTFWYFTLSLQPPIPKSICKLCQVYTKETFLMFRIFLYAILTLTLFLQLSHREEEFWSQ